MIYLIKVYKKRAEDYNLEFRDEETAWQIKETNCFRLKSVNPVKNNCERPPASSYAMFFASRKRSRTVEKLPLREPLTKDQTFEFSQAITVKPERMCHLPPTCFNQSIKSSLGRPARMKGLYVATPVTTNGGWRLKISSATTSPSGQVIRRMCHIRS